MRARGIRLAHWDDAFGEVLLRVLEIAGDPTDRAVLGAARLRELYYAILKGEAGIFARLAFGAGNAISRSARRTGLNRRHGPPRWYELGRFPS